MMKQWRKSLALILSLVLLSGTIAARSIQSSAAKVIKLNKKSIAITVGKTYKLKLKGTTKKVKWSSSKKSVATVSAKGVVKGKKAGKAKITAKLGKKKYTCKVTVNKKKVSAATPTPSSTPAPTPAPVQTPVPEPPKQSNVDAVSTDQLAANVGVKCEKANTVVLLSVTNNNDQWLHSLKVNYNLKTSQDISIDADFVYFYGVPPHATQTKTLFLIDSNDIELLDVNKTIVSKTVEYYDRAVYTDQSAKVTLTSEKNLSGDIVYTIKNNAGTVVEGYAIIYFYDKNGTIIDADYSSFSPEINETKIETFYAPYDYDEDYNRITTYSTYKIVHYAHSYILKNS